MKRIFKYGAFALLALLVSATFQSCDDDKDIVMITEELPLKVDHLYMVGDATPTGYLHLRAEGRNRNQREGRCL